MYRCCIYLGQNTQKKAHLFTDVLFFCYIRLAASSMHKCVICPSDVICASRVKSSRANIGTVNSFSQIRF